MARKIILIAHNVRSIYNVGSLFRSAEGLGAAKIILSGYTPYPRSRHDERPPHISQKVDRQIKKTALGAEESLPWVRREHLAPELSQLKTKGYALVALEQTAGSVDIRRFKPPAKIALIVGSEVGGLDKEILGLVDTCVEIPMLGEKESFNVSVAAAIALYEFSKP